MQYYIPKYLFLTPCNMQYIRKYLSLTPCNMQYIPKYLFSNNL